MNPILAVLLVLGVVCVVVGAAALSWPAGLIAVGIVLLLAAADLSTSP